MSWMVIVLLVLAAWLALKVVSVLFRLLLWAVVLALIWWLVHGYLGMPLWPF
jgi:hypothetical protein